MKCKLILPALAVTIIALAIPGSAFAQTIPFFGPIVPESINLCPANFAMFMDIINRIILFAITMVLVLVAPLITAYAGFLLVVNPFNSGAKETAKKIMLNMVIGIVVALAGWLIVDAVMVVLTPNNGRPFGTRWSEMITTGGQSPCLIQAGALLQLKQGQVTGSNAAGELTVTPFACSSIQSLSPLTDPGAVQMESGQTVVWTNADPRLQPCVNRFISQVGGRVTSAYRPQSYQTHLWEIRDRWCTKNLRTTTDPSCSSLKDAVSNEVNKHFGSNWSCGAVAETNSTHGSGIGVDISEINHASSAVQNAARASCLDWKNYSGDPYHYDLISSCTCS